MHHFHSTTGKTKCHWPQGALKAKERILTQCNIKSKVYIHVAVRKQIQSCKLLYSL